MSTRAFTNLPSSDDELENESGVKNFRLRLEASADDMETTSSSYYHSDSPFLNRKRDSPLDLSRILQVESECSQPEDLPRLPATCTPSQIHKKRFTTSTPLSSRSSTPLPPSSRSSTPLPLNSFSRSSTPLPQYMALPLPTPASTSRSSTPLHVPTMASSSRSNTATPTTGDTPVIEEIKKLMEHQTEMFMNVVENQNSLLEQILDNVKRLQSSQAKNVKTGPKKIHVPAQVKQSIRDAFKHEQSNGLSWSSKTRDGDVLKHTSLENRPMTEAICIYVKGQYPSTEEGVIRSGIETHFTSFKQKNHLVQEGKMAAHKQKMALYSRKSRKLRNRQKALRAKNLTKEELDKMMQGLRLEYMSSEESDSDDETQLIVRPISWRSKMFDEFVAKLDHKYNKGLPAQGKKLRSKRKIGRPTERPCPQKPDGLEWVFS